MMPGYAGSRVCGKSGLNLVVYHTPPFPFAVVSAIRRKFSHSNRPSLPYVRPAQGPVDPPQRQVCISGLVEWFARLMFFQPWNFSNFLTRLNPLRRLRSVRRLDSVEEGLSSDEDPDVESSTQTRFQTSFQRVRFVILDPLFLKTY